jgi:hypothetical protein
MISADTVPATSSSWRCAVFIGRVIGDGAVVEHWSGLTSGYEYCTKRRNGKLWVELN